MRYLAMALIGIVMMIDLSNIALAGPGGGAGKGNKGNGPAAQRFERIRQILDKLDLSADQHKTIDQVISDAQAQLRDLRTQAKGSTDKDALKEKAKAIFQDMRTKIVAQLTPEQKAKFREEMKAMRDGQTKDKGDKQPTTQP